MIGPRRLRKNPIIKNLVAEVQLSKNMFVQPYFVKLGNNKYDEIDMMPGVFQWSIDKLLPEIESNLKIGLDKILLFGVDNVKDANASSANNENNAIAESIKEIKQQFGKDIFVISDVCLCAHTTDGHCGLNGGDLASNNKSVDILANMALMHAQMGVDMVSPSDMMDGRVLAIRDKLDEHSFDEVSIMSYTAKYASAYYGPFREAANSAPAAGSNRQHYQMDIRNKQEAVKEALLDEAEGADVLMVKPALAFLDIIQTVKENTLLPVACYNVSGEYSMVKIGTSKGLFNERDVVIENMTSFARAGASIVISYHTKDIFKNNWLF